MAGFWDTLSGFIPETERTKMYKRENALRLRTMEREEEAAAREEENLIRQRGAQSQLLTRLAPTRTVANTLFASNAPTSELYAQAMPEQALASRVQSAGLGPQEEFNLGPNEVRMRGNDVIARNTVSTAPAFKPTNMQVPGTDKIALARTQADYDALAEAGYVESGTSVPGAKAPTAPKDMFGDEAKLRGEFDTKTAQYALVRDAYSKISEVAKDPSPAGDISLIFSYMKMLDPGSTVREGEYATAQNAGSIPNSIWARYNQAVAGETLTPPQRADFLRQSSNIFKSADAQYRNDFKRYEDLANQYKIDPRRVVYDRSGGVSPQAVPKYVAPKSGTVVDGYTYLGGDPNDQKSWKKN